MVVDTIARQAGIDMRKLEKSAAVGRGELQGKPVSLQPLREALESRHRILLRDCRSFEGLDATWLRIGYQDRAGNRRIIRAMRQELNSISNPASN